MTNSNRNLLILGLCLAAFMVNFSLATTHLFTPHIQRQFHAATSQMNWLMTSYVFSFIPALLVAGSLADRYGTRLFILLGIIIFAIGCIGNSLSPNILFMIIMHGIQGIGAGLLWAALFASLMNVFTEQKQKLAIACLVCVTWLAIVLGFVVTLSLHKTQSWRWLAALDILVAIAAFIICWLHLPKSTVKNKAVLDYLGIALLILASVSLVYSVHIITIMGFANLTTEICLFVFVIILMLFVWREFSCQQPILNLPLLINSLFFASLFVRAITIFSYIALIFMLNLFYQHIHHLSETQVILFFLPLFISVTLFAFLTGLLCRVFSPITIMLIGILIIILGFWLISNQENFPLLYSKNTWQTLLVGAGFGLVFSSNVLIGLQALPQKNAGMAASIFYFSGSLLCLLSTPICHDIAKSGAIKLVYENFLRLGVPVSHWQQTQLAIANFHLRLESYVSQHYSYHVVNHFIPPLNHLYAHSFDNASTLIIVLLLIAFTFMALVAAGRK